MRLVVVALTFGVKGCGGVGKGGRGGGGVVGVVWFGAGGDGCRICSGGNVFV